MMKEVGLLAALEETEMSHKSCGMMMVRSRTSITIRSFG
jgi:hypothetical protein